MPKVCFLYYSISNYDPILYREAKALRERGFDIDIICLRKYPKEEIFTSFEGLNLYRIQSRPSSEKNPILYFLRLGLFSLKATILLSFLALREKYAIIHITAPPDTMVFAAIIPKLLGAGILLDIHDIGPELFMRKAHVTGKHPIVKIIEFLERLSSRFSDHVITVTDLWRHRLISRSVPSSKCTVILNVPDENLFKPFSSRNLNVSHGFNLYYHGSFEEHFGVDTLLEAMPIIKQHIPDVMLHLYGGGRLLDDFEKLARRLDIEDVLVFHGSVPFYDLPRILASADLGVVPTKGSVFSDEAVSMKSLEYMSLGIPIVISKTKAHSFYYDSLMVRFFTPRDENELATSVIDLYQNSEERARLAGNAQDFIRRHGWNKAKKTYLQIVDRLISDRFLE